MCIQKQEGTTPVMAAVENNSVELLQLLLAYNADLNQPKVGYYWYNLVGFLLLYSVFLL